MLCYLVQIQRTLYKMNPAVLPFSGRRNFKPVPSHFIIIAIIVVPELIATNGVLDGKLKGASGLQKRGRDDFEGKLIRRPIAGLGNVGRLHVEKR